MRNSIKRLTLFFVIFIAGNTASSQVYICDNGSFESGYSNYSFQFVDGYLPPAVSCSINTSTIPAYMGMSTTVNNFSNPVTLVNGDLSVSGGFDPSLAAYNVDIHRVLQGEYAIKLNDENLDNAITVMSKSFTVNEELVTYKFSIVALNHILLTEQPHFIARLYNSTNSKIAENCIPIDSSNPIFNTTSGNEMLYSGWLCGELSTVLAEENEVLTIEFTITDDSKGDFSFATVYIDDICNDICCPECPIIETDVPTGSIDHQDASMCINAYNTVNDGAVAEYHAAYEVVLLPGGPLDPTAVPGFESLYGSDGYYHILGCDVATEPEGRQNMFMEQDGTGSLQIYPNPANNELNIISDTEIASLTLIALDGKIIMVRDEVNYKNHKLDLTGVAQGIYILTVETTDGSITSHKLIKD